MAFAATIPTGQRLLGSGWKSFNPRMEVYVSKRPLKHSMVLLEILSGRDVLLNRDWVTPNSKPHVAAICRQLVGA